MFDNKDYCKFTHGLMIFAIFFGYSTVFEYSRKLGITWVNAPISYNIRLKPPLNPDPFMLYITIFLVVIALSITLLRCFHRITSNVVYWKDGLKDWAMVFVGYFFIFLAVLAVWPFFFSILRGW